MTAKRTINNPKCSTVLGGSAHSGILESYRSRGRRGSVYAAMEPMEVKPLAVPALAILRVFFDFFRASIRTKRWTMT